MYNGPVDDGEAETNPNAKRILIFASQKGLELLMLSQGWGGDGTFSVVQEPIKQLYTLMALVDGTSYASIYMLLPDKKAKTYAKAFSVIRDALTENHPFKPPQYFMVDFEISVIKEFKSIFPEVKKVTGCYVHLRRSMLRHMGTNHLLGLYNKSVEFAELINCLAALVYVPLPKVREYYQAILDHLPNVMDIVLKKNSDEDDSDDEDSGRKIMKNVDDFFNYWEESYMGSKTRSGWSAPRFPPMIWNLHDAVINNLPKTTNGLEAYHSGLRKAVPLNGTLWSLIDALIGNEAKVSAKRIEDLFNCQAGPQMDDNGLPTRPMTSRQSRASMSAHELLCLVNRIEELGKLEFLQLAASRINLNS